MKQIVLVGMPGAGKSTVGVVLAKKLGFRFVDSDLVIQDRYEKLLHELIAEYGVDGFLKIENAVNSEIAYDRAVIATGGSAIYGKEAMEHFKETGIIVYLKLSYEEIEERLGDLEKRGVTLRPGQTLLDLYNERVPLYEKYADITINCNHKQLRAVAENICEMLEQEKANEKS